MRVGADGAVEIFTDWIGAGSIFYTTSGRTTYFSSHLGLLLQILPTQPRLNQVGVAAQLLGRSQIFDETHFEGVFRLPAGMRLLADQNGARLAGSRDQWLQELMSTDAPPLSPSSFWAMMDHSVQRESYDRTSILMYSGGRDSTAIAIAASEYPDTSATYGESYSVDAVRGRRRAKKLGYQALTVPYEEWTLNTYRPQVIGLHAGCSGLQTGHNILGVDWVKEKASLAVVGFLGDALTGAHSGPTGHPDRKYALGILLPSHRDPLLGEVYAEESEYIKSHVIGRFNELAEDIGPTGALMILDLQWRQARSISMMFDLCDWFLPVSCPFMHRQLIASALTASTEALAGQHAYDLALAARLQRRGHRPFTPEPRGERIWTELRAGLTARLRGRHIVGRCDWHAAMQRTEFDANEYTSGDDRLDSITRESWSQWEKFHGPTNVPVAFASAPIAAAAGGHQF